MNSQPRATAFVEADSSLSSVMAALQSHDDKALVIEYSGRPVGAGYHVTEVKAGSFVALDCGGNPDAWQEIILQVEDLPADAGRPHMKAGKFRAILAHVDRELRLDRGARLTFEIGPPDLPMQVYDVAGVEVGEEAATIRLAPRPAICKPRHRLAQATPCCLASAASKGCCK